MSEDGRGRGSISGRLIGVNGKLVGGSIVTNCVGVGGGATEGTDGVGPSARFQSDPSASWGASPMFSGSNGIPVSGPLGKMSAK